jgi:hypothetical protein
VKTTRRQRFWRWLARIAALGLLLTAIDYFAYPYGQWHQGHSGNRGENGLWLRYPWYFGDHSDAEEHLLAEQLTREQIHYAYFHVRSIRADGTLAFHKPVGARRLVANIHRAAPGVQVMAWIYAGNTHGLGRVDLSNPAVRRSMVGETVWLTQVCGFDGVQWDYEVCDDGDPHLLQLLRQTRAALGPGKILSIATALRLPGPFQHWGWRDGYFAQVAADCDQITVMGYDSGAWLPRGYVALLRQQVVCVTQDAAQGNPRCRVLIGVPTYGDGTASHNPQAENLPMALLGVRQGLADPQTRQATFAGVALFADYTTQPDEWRDYDRLWLRTG